MNDPTLSTLSNDSEGYRRGSVFGFTLAEILLLLIFCILLFYKINDERQKENENALRATIDELNYSLAEFEVVKHSKFITQLITNAQSLENTNPQKAEQFLNNLNGEADYLNQLQLSTTDEWDELKDQVQEAVSKATHSDFITQLITSAQSLENTNPQKVEQFLNNLNDESDYLNQLQLSTADEWVELKDQVQEAVSKATHSDFITQLIASAQSLENTNPQKAEQFLNNLNDESNYLNQLQLSTADEWVELTTQAQRSVPEEIYSTLSQLNETQTNNLLQNVELASNFTASELEQMTTKQDNEVDPEKAVMINQVSKEQLEKLIAGELVEEAKNWPPIISLSEARNYSFQVGSASLTAEFKEQIKGEIANQVLSLLKEYDADVIEVIGHTDLQPMREDRKTNLDDYSIQFLQDDDAIALRAKDNAGLGYARALSVAKELMRVPALADYTILPYSAAQVITPGETLNDGSLNIESSQLRRIEIRVRRKQS